MTTAPLGRSSSVENPTHWWYQARERLMRTVFSDTVPVRATALEIGSADGPSTAWLRERTRRIATDRDPAGLRPGDVCADAEQLPFADGSFQVVAAFDVIEHLADPAIGLAEMQRVLRPRGLLLISVPAYQWAWTDFDTRAGHHRRYTRDRLRREVEGAGFEVVRITHAFAGTLPLFALDRLRSRFLGRPETRVADGDPPGPVTWLLRALARIDEWLLRRTDLPFGSSVFAVARATAGTAGTAAGDTDTRLVEHR